MAVACLLTMLVQAPNGVWSAACFYHCVMMGETYYTVGTPPRVWRRRHLTMRARLLCGCLADHHQRRHGCRRSCAVV